MQAGGQHGVVIETFTPSSYCRLPTRDKRSAIASGSDDAAARRRKTHRHKTHSASDDQRNAGKQFGGQNYI